MGRSEGRAPPRGQQCCRLLGSRARRPCFVGRGQCDTGLSPVGEQTGFARQHQHQRGVMLVGESQTSSQRTELFGAEATGLHHCQAIGVDCRQQRLRVLAELQQGDGARSPRVILRQNTSGEFRRPELDGQSPPVSSQRDAHFQRHLDAMPVQSIQQSALEGGGTCGRRHVEDQRRRLSIDEARQHLSHFGWAVVVQGSDTFGGHRGRDGVGAFGSIERGVDSEAGQQSESVLLDGAVQEQLSLPAGKSERMREHAGQIDGTVLDRVRAPCRARPDQAVGHQSVQGRIDMRRLVRDSLARPVADLGAAEILHEREQLEQVERTSVKFSR
ncbi:unannotated protein [freshwater metagenome]|uniref:Unannotated protein n=1 Tax=freshwater metagenome TaxID=449393 RepID=A0A6J7HDL2_9ZZZZ